jgi:phosphatidylserine/phosphatidylglycerophosphate/cardiolipin synthase-like enzyme
VRIHHLVLSGILIFCTPGSEARSKTERLAERAAKVVTNTLAEAPLANEVCFSPVGPCEVKLLKFIASAKKTIDVAVFDINLTSVVNALMDASKRIPVRVLVDRRNSKSPHSGVTQLIRGGVKVRYGRQKGIMHHKFILIDGVRLETGSFNFTNGAANKNQENQVYLDEPAVVSLFQKQFEWMWGQSLP